MNRVLIIDDEEKLRNLMARIIRLESVESVDNLENDSLEVDQVGTAKAALKELEHQSYDVIICDVKLPDAHGLDLLAQIKQRQPLCEVILLTAYGNIPDGVQAIKNGAFDYITKGDDNNKIIPLLHRAFEKVKLAKRVQQLEKQMGAKYAFEHILGESKGILQAIALGKKVADTDTTVLLLGETGTGKEIFSQALHYESKRRDKAFVALNCSAFSRELLESELFGHKAGSFTGAIKDKKGFFEEAHGGTLFLDEIGEMPVELQAKLLRVLESGEFLKVGETKARKTDVRIIAATNRDLQQEIENGNFRNDLYYRLSVFHITLPPLRERKDDITLLAHHFAQIFAAKTNKKNLELSPAYIQALENNHWKGNIRELKNVIERSVIIAEQGRLELNCLPYELQHPDLMAQKSGNTFSLSDIEKLHIRKTLEHTQGNKAEAARLLEIGIATLYRKLEEYRI